MQGGCSLQCGIESVITLGFGALMAAASFIVVYEAALVAAEQGGGSLEPWIGKLFSVVDGYKVSIDGNPRSGIGAHCIGGFDPQNPCSFTGGQPRQDFRALAEAIKAAIVFPAA